MWSSRGKQGGLCPISLGLAIGITSALAVLVGSIYVMYYGYPPMLAARDMPLPTWGDVGLASLFAFIKGFVFGFLIALFYDLFSCVFKGRCGRKGAACGCDCGIPGKTDGSCGCSCCGRTTRPDKMGRDRTI